MTEESIKGPATKLIVGLGNPGKRYARTRHNVGFMVVDELARRLGSRGWREERLASTSEASFGAILLYIVKPQTFMNLSGQAVIRCASRIGAKPEHILVVSDDLDLPFGRLRLRPGGSTGGHNGLRSVAAELQTEGFPRLRVGIGRPDEGDPIDYVLAPFSSSEVTELPRLCAAAVDMITVAVEAGLLVAMNRFNGLGNALAPATGANPPAPPVPGQSA